jgi:hypothetical protein
MGSALILRPATFADLYRIPLPNGMQMLPPEQQFKSEPWLGEHSRAVETADGLLAVYGWIPLWPGVGHAFAFIHREPQSHALTLVRAGRLLIQQVFREAKLRRLQSTVDASFSRGIRFLLHLGFSIEGLMTGYGPDESDHLMLSMTRKATQ